MFFYRPLQYPRTKPISPIYNVSFQSNFITIKTLRGGHRQSTENQSDLLVIKLCIFFSKMSGKTAQWVEVLATGPEDLIWIPGTHLMLEGKLTPHSWLLSLHVYCAMYVPIYTCIKCLKITVLLRYVGSCL